MPTLQSSCGVWSYWYWFCAFLTIIFSGAVTAQRFVTIHNDQPRLDVNGNYVDAHDGKILYHNGTFFLYGEAYGNQTLATPYPWKSVPRLIVYTSPDLINWTRRGT